MPNQLTPEQIEAARARGAETQIKPKSVEISNADSFFKHMHDMAQQMAQVQKNSQAAMLSAIQRLTEAIREKKMEGTDVSGLIEAVSALKTETEIHHEPVAWDLDVEYNNRGRIGKARFTPVKGGDL